MPPAGIFEARRSRTRRALLLAGNIPGEALKSSWGFQRWGQSPRSLDGHPGKNDAGGSGARAARSGAGLHQCSILATVSPKADGVGTMVTPELLRISTFSCADSPKAETIAPAWPMRRPLGAERSAASAAT